MRSRRRQTRWPIPTIWLPKRRLWTPRAASRRWFAGYQNCCPTPCEECFACSSGCGPDEFLAAFAGFDGCGSDGEYCTSECDFYNDTFAAPLTMSGGAPCRWQESLSTIGACTCGTGYDLEAWQLLRIDIGFDGDSNPYVSVELMHQPLWGQLSFIKWLRTYDEEPDCESFDGEAIPFDLSYYAIPGLCRADDDDYSDVLLTAQ